MAEVMRRLCLNGLAMLPLWLAIGAVALLAHDLTEVAAATIGAAVLIGIAGVLAIASVTRRCDRAAREHGIVVSQSLALIDCMKEINRRVMDIEAGAAKEASAAPESAMAVVTDMPTPCAVNDAAQKYEAAREPPVTTQPVEARPAEPIATALLSLADATPRGVVLGAAGEDMADLVPAAIRHLERGAASVEIVLDVASTSFNEVIAGLAGHIAQRPADSARCLIGIDQEQLRAGGVGTALGLARATRLGIGLALRGVTDRETAPETLAACDMGRITVDAGWLLREVAREPAAATGWIAACARQNIELVATGIQSERVADMLTALGVPYGAGEGVKAAALSAPQNSVKRAPPWVGRRARR